MTCSSSGKAVSGLLGECAENINIGCVPITIGMPTEAPFSDQLPIRKDSSTNCLWFYICKQEEWVEFCPGSICNLEEVDIDIVNDICDALNIPVTYDMNGTCVEGTITLQDLATKLQDCITISTDQYVPVLLEETNALSIGACFLVDDDNNAGNLYDSQTSLSHSGVTTPMLLSFTNPTNQPGLLTISASLWANRQAPHSNTPAQVMMMVGKANHVAQYTFDETQQQPVATPIANPFVSYDTRLLPTEEIYAFWGHWNSGVCPACDMSMEAKSDLSHQVVLAAGETFEIAGRVAIGYRDIPTNANPESGWLGATIGYTFQGHNLVTV